MFQTTNQDLFGGWGGKKKTAKRFSPSGHFGRSGVEQKVQNLTITLARRVRSSNANVQHG